MTAIGDSGRVYAGRSMVDRRADRRRKFLEAGIEVLGEKGYAATSVSDICAAAGLARNQFYGEFANREKLLIDVYDLIQSDLLAAVDTALRSVTDGDRREIVAMMMAAQLDSLGSDPRRARICYLEMVGVSDAVERHRAQRREKWLEYFEQTLRAQVGADFVPPGGYRAAATAYLGALTELVSDWSRAAPPRPSVDAIVETMVAVLSAFVPDLD